MGAESKLNDIHKQFGKKVILYAEDIAELIGEDHQAVKAVKAGMGIPLPLKKIRGRYGISTVDVAAWLSTPDAPKAPKKSGASSPPLSKPSRSRPSLGKALLALRTQLDFLNQVHSALEAIDLRRVAPNAD